MDIQIKRTVMPQLLTHLIPLHFRPSTQTYSSSKNATKQIGTQQKQMLTENNCGLQ